MGIQGCLGIRHESIDLAERRASYGKAGYALQFLLDTSQTDALRYPLRLSDIMALPLEKPEQPPSRLWWSPEAGAAALDRLVELIKKAAERPKPRKATRPTRAARQRRLDEKRRRKDTKRDRRRVEPSND